MFILPGFFALWMGWLLARTFAEGQVRARGVAFPRAKEPFWFWLIVAIYASAFLAAAYMTVLFLWYGAFPETH